VSAFTDGTLVVLWEPTRQDVEYALGEIPMHGRMRVIESNLPVDQLGIAVAPDDRAYFYARHSGNANQIIRRRRNGGAPDVVPGGVSASSGFSISRDGKRLAYSTCRETNHIAWLPKDGPATDVLPSGNWRDTFPSQLDDHRFVFSSDRAGEPQVWIYDSSTKQAHPLTGPGASMPAVSHDGRLFAYEDRSVGGILVAPIAGGVARRLSDRRGDSGPHFSFDDASVIFMRTGSDGTGVAVVPTAGGAITTITGPGVIDAVASPTKDQVIYLQSGSVGGAIMMTDLHGTRHAPAFGGMSPGDYQSPQISPDGKHLLLLRKLVEVVELDLDDRALAPRVLWKAGTDGLVQVNYSRDGKAVLAATSVFDGDLWVADGDFR
jgi:Tol biopolymer transport system component